MAEEKRETGVVTRWLKKGGYGFIKPHAYKEDLFVHYSEIQSNDAFRILHEGQVVEFLIAKDDKNEKWKAIDVTPPGGGTFDSSRRRRSGVVKLYKVKKGYGFIKPHGDGGEDLFFHFSEIQSDDKFRTLHPDQEVEFYMALDEENNRMKAVDVTPPGGGKFDTRLRRSPRRNGNGSAAGGVDVKCYNCRGVGHTERVCPSYCYTCGDPAGHLARECPSGGAGGRRGGGKIKQETRKCHGCGKTGHIQRDCKDLEAHLV